MDFKATECLYDQDAYLREFSAAVLSCEPVDHGYFDVVLDRTAFFPEQGGQTADTGTLNGHVRVLDAHIREGIIHHICDAALEPGMHAEGGLDFDRRFSHMQQHTGEHILSGTCAREFGCRNVGFHLSDRIVTVDYDKPLNAEQLERLEDLSNRAVWANLPVRCWYPSAEEAEKLNYRSKKEIDGRLRIVSIPGVDDCACCAPHVRSTGEVGLIRIMSAASYKGGVRLSILCGERALCAVRQKQRWLDGLCRQMTCGEDEIAQVMSKRDAELKELKLRCVQLETELLLQKARKAREDGEQCLLAPGADMQAMIRAAACLSEGRTGTVGVFSGNDRDGYTFCLMGGESLRETFAAFRTRLKAQGGGDSQLIRGKCASAWTEISAFMNTGSDER